MTMKRIMLALVALMAGAGVAKAQSYYDQGYNNDQGDYDDQGYDDGYQNANYQASASAFYDTLSPYGDWVYVGSYGRVWRPSAAVVGAGFRPYATGGNWIYTDYGWSWESDWDWGWAPFHYGRWLMDPVYGWVWVPGNTWGPAWVDWRFGGGYVGWAPLAPYGVTVSYDSYSPWWVFVDTPHFCDYGVYRYALPYNRAVTTAWPVSRPYRETVAYGRARYYAGPPASHIATSVGVPITPVHVAAPRPGVISPVRAHVAASPQVARGFAQSPYHAIASGRVAPAPQVMTGRTIQPQGGVHTIPATPVRPATPVQPHAFPAQPIPRAQPSMPARPAPQPMYHAAPAPQPQYHAAPAPQYRPAPAPQYHAAPAPQPQYHAAPAPQYRPAPAPQYRAAPAPQYRPAPAPQYRPAPAPQYRAAPAPMARPAPQPRNNAAAAQPFRHR